MRRFTVTLGGLVLCASPLFAQDYIDLEAERAGNDGAAPVTREASPTTASPSQANTTTYLDAPPQSSPPATAEGSSAGELFYQLQLLQQEVMELRGRVEEQGHEIRQLKQQSLERYQDIDRRLSGASGTPGNGSGPAEPATGVGQELPGEADAYRAAYSLVRSQAFDDAVAAFRQFLKDYPAGRYAPNAHYWLGELYLVVVPPDLESSRREFVLLIDQYPDNPKVPDALYKLGKVHFEKGDRERAREYLERVIGEFGESSSSAVKLARDFLSENF